MKFWQIFFWRNKKEKNSNAKGTKTLFLEEKKYQSHHIFRGKKFGIVATEKKIQCKKGF